MFKFWVGQLFPIQSCHQVPLTRSCCCFFLARPELPVRRGEDICAEGAARAGVEAAGGAVEALWEGEEEVHRGGNKTQWRGDARTSMSMSWKWRCIIKPQFTPTVARRCRGRPSRRTGPFGSKTSFYTWLHSWASRNLHCRSLKAPFWSVSVLKFDDPGRPCRLGLNHCVKKCSFFSYDCNLLYIYDLYLLLE